MFNYFLNKRKNRSEKSTLVPLNIIGIKTDSDHRYLVMVLVFLMTLTTLYSLVCIELQSFCLLDDFHGNLYKMSSAQLSEASFTKAELTSFFILLLVISILICLINTLKKNQAKVIISAIILYFCYFGYHYKNLINGFFHAANKSLYRITTLEGKQFAEYYVPTFAITDIKTELKTFMAAIIIGTCFLLAYSSINHCNPLIFSTCVIIYAAVPFVCNTFVGEGYLLYSAVICIVLLIMRIQGYSNFNSKKIFAGIKDTIKIRGCYVSYASFQQAIIFLIVAGLSFGTSSIFVDYKNYSRSEEANDLAVKIVNQVDKITRNSKLNELDPLGNSSKALNNGDLKNLGNLEYSGESMFSIMSYSSKIEKPLYLRSYTAGVYQDQKWDHLSDNKYNGYKFWNTFSENSFIPQTLLGDISCVINSNMPVNTINILNKGIDPSICLNEYRMSSAKSDIVMNNVTYRFDNEFTFDSYESSRSYIQQISISNAVPAEHINVLGSDKYGNISSLIRYGSFSLSDEDFTGIDLSEYKEYEKTYRDFVSQKYLQTPDNIEKLIPKSFDEDIANIYNSHMNQYNSEFINYYDQSILADIYSDIIEYIRTYIQHETQYTLSPGSTPTDRDAVEYFLNENKKGYCTHYATAAALLLRRAGIPSRYAEGYYVSSSRLRSGQAEIPDSNSHAWAEAYYPLLGWQVVECTPHYGNGNSNGSDSHSDTDIPDNSDTADTTTDIDTDTTIDTDSESSDKTNGTNTDNSIDSDINTDSSDIQEFHVGIKNTGEIFSTVLNVLKYILIIVLIVILWRTARFIVRKIRYKIFHNADSRKAALSMYSYSLFLLKIYGTVPNKGEGDREFSKRAAVSFDDIKSEEYEIFTLTALDARFGKNPPDIQSIESMNMLIEKFSISIMSSSPWWKKLFFKLIIFIN